jgi:hypothetical protein
MTSGQARQELQACELRFWELAGDSNPQPAVYKTGADRPRRTGLCSPCRSGQMLHPASAVLSCGVSRGGTTEGMTGSPMLATFKVGPWCR